MKLRFHPWWLISGMALAMSAHATQPVSPAQDDDTDAAIETVEYNGMKVGIDKKTGKLRPLTAEESQQLDAILTQQRASGMVRKSGVTPAPANEAAAVATTRRTASGAMAMKLPQSQMEYITAKRDANGNIVLQHSSEEGTTEEQAHE